MTVQLDLFIVVTGAVVVRIDATLWTDVVGIKGVLINSSVPF